MRHPTTGTPVPRSRPGFADVFADVVRSSGMPISTLSERLKERGVPVSVATLSYWQNGRTLPTRRSSFAVLEAIEDILGLHDRLLFQALPYALRADWEASLVVPPQDDVQQALVELGLDLVPRHVNLAIHDQLTIGEHGVVRGHRVRQVLRPEVEGLLEWPVIYNQGTAGGPGQTPPGISHPRGAELDRSVTLPDGLFVGAMRIPRPVHPGEELYVDYQVDWLPVRDDSLQRMLPQLVRQVVLDVEFTADLPLRALYSWTPLDAEEAAERLTVPVLASSTQRVVANAGAGAHLLSWEWDT